MKDYKFFRMCRHMRTTQEKRAYGGRKNNPLVRAKRNPANLPDNWDSIWVRQPKTWKHKRKTQYNPLDLLEE